MTNAASNTSYEESVAFKRFYAPGSYIRHNPTYKPSKETFKKITDSLYHEGAN